MERYFVIDLTVLYISCIFNFACSYCPPLVAPEDTNLYCRLPNDLQFSNCSSSWLPNGTIARYECENCTNGEKIIGYILCLDSEERSLRKMEINSTELPCDLRRDFSVPEIHIFGYLPATNFTTPNPNYYENGTTDNITSDKDVMDAQEKPERDYERLALKLHNVFRIRHGSPALKLKKELNDAAQRWADHLSEVQNFDLSKSNLFGQNLFNSKSNDKIQAVSDATQNWYYEGMKVYNWSNIEENWENSLALNFAQLVWTSTEYLGIGVSNWSGEQNGSVVVAYYYPTGNVVTESELPEKHFLENVHPLIT